MLKHFFFTEILLILSFSCKCIHTQGNLFFIADCISISGKLSPRNQVSYVSVDRLFLQMEGSVTQKIDILSFCVHRLSAAIMPDRSRIVLLSWKWQESKFKRQFEILLTQTFVFHQNWLPFNSASFLSEFLIMQLHHLPHCS